LAGSREQKSKARKVVLFFFFFPKGGSDPKRKIGKSCGRLLEAVRGEEGGERAAAFFYFLREEGLRLRKETGLGFFCVWYFFLVFGFFF
jgi:hypothetical protein